MCLFSKRLNEAIVRARPSKRREENGGAAEEKTMEKGGERGRKKEKEEEEEENAVEAVDRCRQLGWYRV